MKDINKWLLLMNEIIMWHLKTFPNATHDGQLIKLEEELNELRECNDYNEQIKETADVFIVLCGLQRWGSALSRILLSTTNFDDCLFDAVVEKMDKNRSRTWEKTTEGTYHHTNKE